MIHSTTQYPALMGLATFLIGRHQKEGNRALKTMRAIIRYATTHSVHNKSWKDIVSVSLTLSHLNVQLIPLFVINGATNCKMIPITKIRVEQIHI